MCAIQNLESLTFVMLCPRNPVRRRSILQIINVSLFDQGFEFYFIMTDLQLIDNALTCGF